MQERAKKSPSTLERFSRTRAYCFSFNPALQYLLTLAFALQGIRTRRHRYRIFKCSPRRLRLGHQGMASITERRRVLGSYARPRVWCPRFSYERGGLGRCDECIGGCIVGEGTHFLFLSVVTSLFY